MTEPPLQGERSSRHVYSQSLTTLHNTTHRHMHSRTSVNGAYISRPSLLAVLRVPKGPGGQELTNGNYSR